MNSSRIALCSGNHRFESLVLRVFSSPWRFLRRIKKTGYPCSTWMSLTWASQSSAHLAPWKASEKMEPLDDRIRARTGGDQNGPTFGFREWLLLTADLPVVFKICGGVRGHAALFVGESKEGLYGDDGIANRSGLVPPEQLLLNVSVQVIRGDPRHV